MDFLNETLLNETTTRFHDLSKPEWKKQLPKAHGVTLIVAWFILVPIAMGGARYFRDYLAHYAPAGLRLWFHVHRGLNIAAVVLMVVGLLCTLISHDFVWTGPKVHGGWMNSSPVAFHTIFGLFSVLLAWIQPINSLFRCGPNHRFRPIFNWSHRTLGVIAWIFAAVSNMFACKYFPWDFVDIDTATVTAALLIAVVGGTFVLAETIKYNSKTFAYKDEIHWIDVLQVILFIVASTLLVVFSTVLCALIAAKIKV